MLSALRFSSLCKRLGNGAFGIRIPPLECEVVTQVSEQSDGVRVSTSRQLQPYYQCFPMHAFGLSGFALFSKRLSHPMKKIHDFEMFVALECVLQCQRFS